jgi:hypothetical protein
MMLLQLNPLFANAYVYAQTPSMLVMYDVI